MPTVLARCLVALPLSIAVAAALAAAPLPVRNLWVEWRQQDASIDARDGVAAGTVVIGSDGRTSGWVAGSRTRTRDLVSDSVQQLQVQNGATASMHVSVAVPLQLMQVVVGPQGIEAAPTTQWLQTGQGFRVRPRWPGGKAPVTVDVDVDAAGSPGLDGSTPGAQRAVSTTLQMPLDAWVTIARSGRDDNDRPAPGTVSTQGLAAPGALLQLRVRLAP